MMEEHPYNLLRDERGMNRLGWLVLSLLVIAGVFVGSQVFPFYYYYWEIQGQMEAQAAKAQVFTDQEIRRYLLDQIKRLEIPIDREEDLKIYRANKKIIIDLKYEELLYIDLGEERVYNLWVFEFNPHVEAVF